MKFKFLSQIRCRIQWWFQRLTNRPYLQLSQPEKWEQESILTDFIRIRELRRIEEQRFQQLLAKPGSLPVDREYARGNIHELR
jgi:hypothetical protein